MFPRTYVPRKVPGSELARVLLEQKGCDSGCSGKLFLWTCILTEMSSTESTSGRQNMTVVVRLRAANAKERESQLPAVAKVVDEKVVVFDPKIQTSPEYRRSRKRSFRDLNKRVNRNVYFAFDRVFDEEASNSEVFSYTAEAVVSDVLNGYNACGECRFTFCC